MKSLILAEGAPWRQMRAGRGGHRYYSPPPSSMIPPPQSLSCKKWGNAFLRTNLDPRISQEAHGGGRILHRGITGWGGGGASWSSSL